MWKLGGIRRRLFRDTPIQPGPGKESLPWSLGVWGGKWGTGGAGGRSFGPGFGNGSKQYKERYKGMEIDIDGDRDE
eukprot:1394942-Amorphochlora_amoeboformis.AAC.2